MTYKLQDLRAASDEELIALHDALAEHTVPGAKYYLDELARRDQERANATMLRLTERMTRLTWIIAILTLANVILVAIAALAA